MKRLLQFSLAAVALLLVTGLSSCKKKMKDADIQAAIEKVLMADPDMGKTTVTVKDGVATLTGECKDEACKAKCETAVKAIEGVTSVVNNCTIAPPPEAVVPPVADKLAQAITDALKDYPTVKSELKDGVLTLTGEIQKTSLQKLMQALNALRPMGLKNIESKGLVRK